MKKLTWQSDGLTDKGVVRKRNEDNLLLLDKEGMWLVADGAGGHANGDIASQITVDCLSTYQTKKRLGSDTQLACSLLKRANEKIIEFSQEKEQVSGSTASIFLTDGQSAVCIWTGDSPIYRLRDNRFLQLSQDHNRVEEFMQQGFSYEECEKIAYAQHLTQALGASETLCFQTRWVDIKENDCFIICSDGVTKELLFSDIKKIAQDNQHSAKQLSKSLVSETINRGARDNTTAITIVFSLS